MSMKGQYDFVKDLLLHDAYKYDHHVSPDHFRALRDAFSQNHIHVCKLLVEYIITKPNSS